MATYCIFSVNILLDKFLTAKVGDFGLATVMPTISKGHSYIKVSEFGGSLGYQAPEILESEIGPKIHVYSLAVVSETLIVIESGAVKFTTKGHTRSCQ